MPISNGSKSRSLSTKEPLLLYSFLDAKHIGAFLSGPGAMEEAIYKQSKLYSKFKGEQAQKGLKPPRGDDVLVFDEVRVVSRLMWNSRNQQIIGLAMSPEDMCSLQDIYMSYDEDATTEQPTYVLQFMWRDLTSKFDIVGPYFTSSQSQIHSCLCV